MKSTINWVDTKSAREVEVRLYDRLFMVENPSASEQDFRELLNPDSLKVIKGCIVDSQLAEAKPLEHFQFLKQGYFTVDKDSTPDKPIFNRTVSLKDNWAKKN